jgi:hypothetical protein
MSKTIVYLAIAATTVVVITTYVLVSPGWKSESSGVAASPQSAAPAKNQDVAQRRTPPDHGDFKKRFQPKPPPGTGG